MRCRNPINNLQINSQVLHARMVGVKHSTLMAQAHPEQDKLESSHT
jgi:hypothetical protein